MDCVQKKMLQVYEQVKNICDLHNLRYYAAGGTKIGAVLWQGIIPWDDDIDLVMPIEDLMCLIDIISKEENEYLGVFDGLSAPYSDIVGVKIFDSRTMFTSYNLLNRPEAFTGVFVDIFPMIGAPSDINSFTTEINLLRDELFKKRLFGQSIEENLALLEQLKEMMYRYPFDKSEIVLNIANPVAEAFSRYEFLEAVDMPFETTTIPVSRFYDKHLKQQYGFYTKDWPEEKRVHSHEEFALLDLNRGIEYYRNAIFSSPIQNYIFKMGVIKENLESQIFSIDDSRKKLDQEKRELVSNLEEILLEKQKVEVELSEKNTTLEALTSSTSWKITKPLRKLSSLFKQIKVRKEM
ncbi:TPA: phosphorylcholine transferase LicD [Streptococcus suis]